MAKPTEKMLYGAFLDLWYANQDYESRLEDMTEDLKHTKKFAKKTKLLLAEAEKQYIELNNCKPRPPK